MSRALLVANAAARSVDDDAVEHLRSILQRRWEVEVVRPGSRDSFASELADVVRTDDLVVVAGGDGTLNCAVNALADRVDDVVFGLLPLGTGNDLARTLELDPDAVAAAEALTAGSRERLLDLGHASGPGAERYFANACMGGFPVKVNEALDPGEKKRLGPLAFAWGAVKTLGDLKTWRVRLGGTEVDACVAVGVGNGRTSGGGIEVWPAADPGDGKLDGAALPAQGVVDALRVAAQVRLGSTHDVEGVELSRAAQIRIEADPILELNVDGDLIGLRTPATFEIVKRWRILVPA